LKPSGSPATLITGGSGFLGSHLCDRLISEGHVVICLDNLLTGRSENFSHLLTHPRFNFVSHDVTDRICLRDILVQSGQLSPDLRLDYVLHFASPASPKDYIQYPIQTLKVGAFGTHHALELAKSHGAIFLLASSSEVYGDPERTPQSEDYAGNVNPIGPRSVYDESKRFGEALASAYRHSLGVDARIARIFNTYGPRMSPTDGRVIPNFMTQALSNMPLTVYGDGTQTRSLCFVEDTVDGIYRLMVSGPLRNDEMVVNIGNPEEVSVLQLAREVLDLTGSSSELVFRPLPEDDPKIRLPDIARAKRLLNWEPKIDRLEGLKMVVPYFTESIDLTALRHLKGDM